MNRLSFAISQGQTMSVAVRASESRIRDANIAEEAAALTKFNILTQSGLAALAQANQSAQAVLQLLRYKLMGGDRRPWPRSRRIRPRMGVGHP